MLTWFREKFPDPKIDDREKEILRLVAVNELWAKNWHKAELALAEAMDALADLEAASQELEQKIVETINHRPKP